MMTCDKIILETFALGVGTEGGHAIAATDGGCTDAEGAIVSLSLWNGGAPHRAAMVPRLKLGCTEACPWLPGCRA